MYKVYSGSNLIHDDNSESLKIMDGRLALELGKSGLFEFTIYPDNAYYDSVVPLLSIIEVHQNGDVIFRGRVLNIKYGFWNEKQVTCEGELAFLLDSIIEPHAFYGSFIEYFSYIIDIHNYQVEAAKQFTVGNVTIAEFYPFEVVDDYNFISSMDTLNKRMVEYSGGYLHVRHENGVMYLDFLSPEANISNMSVQKIKLGENLVDIKRDVEGGEVFSGIVPLGAKIGDTENRVDISSVNSGSYSILNDQAVAAYGRIFRTVVFENITDPATLKAEAVNWLNENFAAINTVEITAADLSGINPELDTFRIGQWVTVESVKHFSAPQVFLIRKMVINLSNPADTRIEVGRKKQGLTDRLGNALDSIGSIAYGIQKASESISGLAENVEAVEARVITLEAIQPYMLESGTSGIWSWKIFSDGTAEIFGKINLSGIAVSASLGSWYRSETLYGVYDYSYPLAFSEAPAVNMMFQTRNGNGALLWSFSATAENAKTYLPQCYLIRPTTATNINGNINIIAKGKI